MDGLPPLPSMTKTVGDVMRVIRVLDPSSDAVSFTLLDENGATLLDEHGAVSPAERYLRYLAGRRTDTAFPRWTGCPRQG